MENTVRGFVSFYFFHRVFQTQDNRNCLACNGKARGADNLKKEFACHIRNELELSVVLKDKQKKGK